MHIVKFLVAGAVGLSVNLGTFHALVVLGIPYLIGSAVAFLVALLVGFILQKFWTFEERTLSRAPLQLAQYAALAISNLAINTLVVYLLVEHARAHYLVAQTVGAGLVAGVSYFVYRFYIFSSPPQRGKTIPEEL